MTCVLNLVPLPCDRTGVGFTSSPLQQTSNKLHLLKGQGRQFPTLIGDEYFYVRIAGCNNCCEVAKVVAVDGDVFTIDRTSGSKCDCVQSNARVSYEWNNIQVVEDIVRSVGINVVSPLKYEPCSRTLSVDCKELFAADCGGCGCGEGAVSNQTPASSTPGARGAKGEQGEPGVGIAQLTVSASGQLLYTLTSGDTKSAGTLPMSKGAKGAEGPKGDRGEQGPKGEDGAHIATISVVDTTATVTMSDGATTTVDVSSLKGERGPAGEQGERGEKGDPGVTYQYVELGSVAYIFGQPNTDVLIKSPQMPGVTFGPYRTDGSGMVQFDKPPTTGKALVQMFVGDKAVGIGSTG